MRSKKKRKSLKKKFIIGTACGVGFLILLFAFLHTGFIRSKALQYVSKYIKSTQKIQFSAESLSYSLLRLRFSLKKVSLRSIEEDTTEKTPFFQAQKVTVDIPLKLVLRKKLCFNEITIIRPEFYFAIHENGGSNLPLSIGASTTGSSDLSIPEIIVKKLLLENAHVDFKDEKKDMAFQLSQLGIQASWEDDAFHKASLAIGQEGSLQYKKSLYPVNQIMLQGRLGAKGAVIEDFRIKALQSDISGSGRIEGFSNPFVHFDFKGSLDAKSLKDLFQWREDISGRLELQGLINGPMDSIHTELRMNSSDIQYGPVKISDFRGEAVWKDEKLIIPSLNVITPDGRIYASAELNPFGWEKGNRLDVTCDSLKPDFWLDLSNMPFGTDTQVSGGFRATWDRLSFEALKVNANLDFSEGKGAASNKVALPIRGRIKAGLDSGRLSVDTEKINIPGASLSGEVQLDSKEISGDYRLKISSIEELIPCLSLFSDSLGNQDMSQWKIGGSAVVSGSIGGKLPSPWITAEIESSQFSVKDLENIKITGKFEYSDRSVSFESFEIQAGFHKAGAFALDPMEGIKAEPKIRAQGQFNLDDKSYQINLVTEPLQIGGFVLNQEEGFLRGLVDVRIEGEGNLGSPNFSTEVNIKDLKKGSKEIGSMVLNIDSIGGEVRYNAIHYPSLSKGSGSFSLHQPFPSVQDLSLQIDMDLALLNSLTDDFRVKGRLKSEFFIPGEFVLSELKASLDISEGELLVVQPGLVLDLVRANIKISEKTVQIFSVTFVCGDGSYALSGDIPFESFEEQEKALPGVPEGRIFTIQASWENVNTSALSPLFSGEILSEFETRFDGRLHVTGHRFQWDRLSGKADINKLQFTAPDVSLELRRPASIAFADGALILSGAEFFGKDGRISVGGTLGLFPEQAADIFLDGEVDLSVLEPFIKRDSVSGKVLFEIKVTQSLSQPHLSGNLEIRNAEWQTDQPSLFLSGVEGHIVFDQTKVFVKQISGDLNGGDIKLSGEVDLEDKDHPLGGLEIKAESILLDFPKGMQSQIDLDLFFSLNEEGDSLSGNLNIMHAKYTEPFKIQSTLIQYLRREASIDSFLEPNEFLSQLRFNVSISARESVFIENNISKSLISANLVLTGTLFKPVLSGRAHFEEGGEIYFGGNTFVIEAGSADFINPNRIEPDLNIRALTRVGEYDIRLILSGTPEKFTASLISEPSMPEPDIISLLVTGKTLESASSQILGVAGNKATTYINSSLTGRLEKATKRTFGLESVKIDASLIAAEENPSARITVGQHVSRDIEFVYSHDLKDARNRMWIMNYNPVRNINIQGIRRDDNEYAVGLQHDLRFGSPDATRPGKTQVTGKKILRLVQVDETGDIVPLDKNILFQMKLKKGGKFDFITLRKDLENIKKYYIKRDHLSAVVRADREEEQGEISLKLFVDPGPKIFIRYQGTDIPRKFRRNVREILIRGAFSRWAFEEAGKHLLIHFTKKRYFMAQIHVDEKIGNEKTREIVFQIDPGIKYSKYSVNMEGNKFISDKILCGYLKKGGQLTDSFVNTEKVIRSLEIYYAQHGFIRAKLTAQKPRFDPESQMAEVTVSIDEGLRFQIGMIKVTGNRFFSEEQIVRAGGLEKPQFYSQMKISEGRLKIRDRYSEEGFIYAQVRSEVTVHEKKGLVDCVFIIDENRQGIINDIEITGNKKTKIDTIRRELNFKKGETLDFQRIGESRKRLYDLGIFERVDIEAVPLNGNTSEQGEMPNETHPIQNYQIKTSVHEFQPYRLRYGIQFDTETFFGLKGELVNRNFSGRALLVGTSFRINRDEQDMRAFVRTPYFFGKKVNTETLVFFNRTYKPTFTVDRTGVTFLQQVKLNRYYMLFYDYTYEHNRTFDLKLSGPLDFDPTAYIGSFSIAVTRDTRDSISNTRHGLFVSQNIKYASKLLGSDTNFIRYFGQAYFYRPVAGFLVYSSGLRWGFAKGIGNELAPSERFFAGGSTTVRGFGKDALGPRDPLSGNPIGGEAVFIFNQELRFPVYKILGGAVFIDLGNVYSSLSDFDPFDIRKTAGLGLRIHTSFMVFRLDWGFKLDPQPGEEKSRFFLSIGQAF